MLYNKLFYFKLLLIALIGLSFSFLNDSFTFEYSANSVCHQASLLEIIVVAVCYTSFIVLLLTVIFNKLVLKHSVWLILNTVLNYVVNLVGCLLIIAVLGCSFILISESFFGVYYFESIPLKFGFWLNRVYSQEAKIFLINKFLVEFGLVQQVPCTSEFYNSLFSYNKAAEIRSAIEHFKIRNDQEFWVMLYSRCILVIAYFTLMNF